MHERFFSENFVYLLLMGLAGVGIFVGLYFSFPKCPHCSKRIGKNCTRCPACHKDLTKEKNKPD